MCSCQRALCARPTWWPSASGVNGRALRFDNLQAVLAKSLSWTPCCSKSLRRSLSWIGRLPSAEAIYVAHLDPAAKSAHRGSRRRRRSRRRIERRSTRRGSSRRACADHRGGAPAPPTQLPRAAGCRAGVAGQPSQPWNTSGTRPAKTPQTAQVCSNTIAQETPANENIPALGCVRSPVRVRKRASVISRPFVDGGSGHGQRRGTPVEHAPRPPTAARRGVGRRRRLARLTRRAPSGPARARSAPRR